MFASEAGPVNACTAATVAAMRYVALLRGINVGGRTLIRMADLRGCVADLGFEEVTTYIASGNVLFTADEQATAPLAERIEAAIEAHFALPVKVVVLDRPGYARVVKAIPRAWIGDEAWRVNVAFLRPGGDAKAIVRELAPDPEIEEVKAIRGAILWAIRREAINRSAIRKLIGGAAYQEMTVRNLNTTLKLDELLG